jgi:hypothetical protein
LKVTAGLLWFWCPSKQRGFRYPNVPAIDASTPLKKYSIHISEFDSSNIGKNCFDREYAKAIKMKLEWSLWGILKKIELKDSIISASMINLGLTEAIDSTVKPIRIRFSRGKSFNPAMR